jgi:hypothetical protein
MKQWGLRKPDDCRAFLKSLTFGPEHHTMTRVIEADGRTVTIDDASDEAVKEISVALARWALRPAGEA